MNDLISREELMNILQLMLSTEDMSYGKKVYGKVIQQVKSLPTIEAEPVKHGRWINVKISISGNSSAECSLCGAVVHNNFSNVINYCPNCGARMFDKDIDVPDKSVGKMDEVEE